MDREANYVAVGAFVLLVLAIGAGFVLWYSNAADGQAAKRYEIYFEGSVGGLAIAQADAAGAHPRVPRRRVAPARPAGARGPTSIQAAPPATAWPERLTCRRR